ncbi:MAG: GLPGLI family protein [Pedobacter sp.]|nr:GLPGLI family protein [Pedobacter sp.]
MKKIINTALIALLFYSTANAQKPDKVLARVRYSFVHQRDTNRRNDPYTENMLLLIGKNESLFTSYDRIVREENSRKQEAAYIKTEAGGAPMGNLKTKSAPFKPVTLVDYYFFVKENKWVTKDKVMTVYLVTEEAPRINWKMSRDTASFSGITCKKATAYFRGRNWIAWYAPELPFSSGPWKLNGLPGLIVEAYDEKKEVKFQFAGIDKATKENTDENSFYFSSDFKVPGDAKSATRSEFDKLKAAFDADPIGFHAAASGMPRNRVLVGGSTSGIVHNIINNPIELPER